jgi:hypothetical protein
MCAVVLTACGDVKGTPVEYANACVVENEKKVVEVSGLIGASVSVYCSNTGGGPVRCGLKLFEKSIDEKGFSADIVQGASANNIEKLERGYKKEDIKVHDNAGKIIDLTRQVKVTGTMNVSKNASMPESDVCFITVAKIEQ